MFYDSFKRYCDSIGKSPTTVAKEIGFSANAPTAWKIKGSTPKSTSVQKIADYFGITTDQLLNDFPEPSHLRHEKGVKIGVLSAVGAGIPLEAISIFDQDDPDAREEISRTDAAAGQYFALRIRGDSMEPEIRHGDIVIVRRSEEFEDGDWVIALVEFRDSGAQYVYYDVENYVWDELKDSYSMGGYYNSDIKGCYNCERIN